VVEGDVLGGGMEWLGYFDYRWTTPSVFFSFWQRRIGLSPGWGGGSQWARILGESAVRKLLIEASLISAPHALKLGLVDRVLSSCRMRDAIAPWCEQLNGQSAVSIRDWSASGERRIFEKLWLAPDHRLALARWKKR
jgi:enoyl-CoA hydratase/carnithine racemase